MIRNPCGPATTWRLGSQDAWLNRMPYAVSKRFVARAVGSSGALRQRASPRPFSKFVGDEEGRQRSSTRQRQRDQPRRQLSADIDDDEIFTERSGGRASTSGRERPSNFSRDRDLRRPGPRGSTANNSINTSGQRNDYSRHGDGDEANSNRRFRKEYDDGGRGDRGRRRRDDRVDFDRDRSRSDRNDNRRPLEVPQERPATEPAVARPPGSATGNRPLPYDLPLVRPDDGDKGTFFAGSSWRRVGASDDVVAALKSLGIFRPSHIQAMAYSALCGPGSNAGFGTVNRPLAPVVLADQAGSGKTLAYLLPMMQMLRQEEVLAGGRVTRPKCPRGIVVAPTVELVQQVLRVARALSGAGLRCRTAAFTGGLQDAKARASSLKTQKDLLSEGVDLVVATPGRLQKLLEGGGLELSQCRMIVLDEVDVLLGDRANFTSQVDPLRAAAPPALRFVLVTATMPQHTFTDLRELWSAGRDVAINTVFGPGLHRTAAGLVEELVDCSGGDEVNEESGRIRKLEALKSLLERHQAPRTLVFCNKIDACRDVENFLKRHDPRRQQYKVLLYHEAIRDDLRVEALTEFLKPVNKQQQRHRRQQQQEEQQQELPEGDVPLVLVATDRTSRGIDVLDCEHVVLFDFPRDPSEYVRRVGRTARGAGGRGTVSSLVLGRQVPLAREIIERNQKGMPLHSIPQ